MSNDNPAEALEAAIYGRERLRKMTGRPMTDKLDEIKARPKHIAIMPGVVVLVEADYNWMCDTIEELRRENTKLACRLLLCDAESETYEREQLP